LSDIAQIASLQRRKQHTLLAVIAFSIALILICLLRFVPPLNDLLTGRPPYAKALTTLMAYEFGRVAQDRFPVTLLGEDDHCDTVPETKIADDQIAGILYALTYSERQHFSCITSYAVPADPSKFTNLQTLRPAAQWSSGPALPRTLKVLAVARNIHVYPAAYLETLHWRMKPRLPISADQAASFAAQQYESRNPSVPADTHASIDIDFEKARALIREPHDKLNSWLMRIIAIFIFSEFCVSLLLLKTYEQAAGYFRSYGDHLSLSEFLQNDLDRRATAVRTRYYDQERQRQEQERKAAAESTLCQDLEERLRFALANLHDEELCQKIQLCLNSKPEIELMKALWAEAQKTIGFRSPEQKLTTLLESLEPLCTEEELNSCRGEVAKILAASGFKAARSYVTGMHDRFRTRMRQREENRSSSQTEIETKQ
jgi:hypothetical protein